MKVLIVEDEEHIAVGLRFNIEAEGHEADIVHDGESAVTLLKEESFAAVVLDVMLPGISGFDVVRKMRERSDYTPVLILTARGRPEDVLQGFAAGADDYLPKPFDLEIFLARLGGLLRRSEWARKENSRAVPTELVSLNGKVVDFDLLEIRDDAGVTQLTLMEMKLLRYLIEHSGRIVSRKTILEDVWGLQEDTDTRAIDNFIVRLRRYLEDEPNNPQLLKTVRGVGYTLSPEKE